MKWYAVAVFAGLALMMAQPDLVRASEEPTLRNNFDVYDANNDGLVSQQEYLNVQTKRFKAFDADGNGSVTKEEASGRIERVRERRLKRRGE